MTAAASIAHDVAAPCVQSTVAAAALRPIEPISTNVTAVGVVAIVMAFTPAAGFAPFVLHRAFLVDLLERAALVVVQVDG